MAGTVTDESPVGSWKVYFGSEDGYSDAVQADPVVLRHARVLDRALRRLSLRPGRPVLVGPGGVPDVRVNQWFDSDELDGVASSTMRKYAYSLVVWLNFLVAYGQPWDEADRRAQGAFKVWRLMDERNPSTVAPGTYDQDLIALRLFYRWAFAEYGVSSPIRVRRGRTRRPDGTPSERPETAPTATRDRNVKWLDPEGYARYRDVGLMGFTADGEDDPGFRGRNSQRDGAFADGLYGTGLRLQEWGSVLIAELPPDDPHRQYYTCHLAADTAKGGYARTYMMKRRALVAVLSYVEGERARAVHRAREAGRYERLKRARIVTKVLGRKRVRLRGADGVVTEASLDSLGPSARRRLLVETSEGLEPAALWLNEDGMARQPHGWEHTFSDANERLRRLGFQGFACTPHMLRHSFALRWYAVGKLVFKAKVAGMSDDEVRDFREQFGDVWNLVQELLGHVDVSTTKNTYLEPFRSLEWELLLMHAADEAVPHLIAEVLHHHPHVLGDPVARTR